MVDIPLNIKEILEDHKNIEILKLLQRNPRMSIAELARKIRMSNPAAKERVRRLENSGVIAGYRLELDPKAAGHDITAFVRIRPLPGHLPKISALAQQIPEVVECHRVTGEDCFILKVHLPEIASLDRVLDRFLVDGQTTTSIVQSSPVPPRSPPIASAPARKSAKRKTGANFCPAFLKAEHSGRRSQFLLGTKTLDPKITAKSRANFDRRMPITLTRPNTESETGRGAVARLRVKRSVASRRVRLQK